MKKLLIVSNYKGSFPYVDELIEYLKPLDVSIDILDLVESVLILNNGDKRLLIDSKEEKVLRFSGKIPFVNDYMRYRILKNKISFLAMRKYDAVNIHYCDNIYVYFIESFKKISANISVAVWGSDFYRVSNRRRELQRKVYNESKSIIIANPKTSEDFYNYYQDYKEKIKTLNFGIKKLTYLKEAKQSFGLNSLKEQFNLPLNKIIVTCGYNGRPPQQHKLILEAIKLLPKQILDTIHLLFPMGYGLIPSYRSEIEGILSTISVSYTISDSFLSDSDIIKLRLATDIVINAQISDVFSSSLMEHLMAGNILLAGAWLPYQSLADLGIFYIDFDPNTLSDILLDVLENYEKYKLATADNADKIYANSSWQNKILQWKELIFN